MIESRPRSLLLECGKLLAQRRVLDDRIVSRPAHGADYPDAERHEEDERADRGREVCRSVPVISSPLSALTSTRLRRKSLFLNTEEY